MNKLLLALLALGGFAFLVPAEAEAGYRSKVIGTCGKCGTKIYATYQPYRVNGCVRYQWVRQPHTCRSQHSHSYNRYSRGYSHGYTRPFVPRYSGPSFRSSYGPSGFIAVPGFSIRFGGRGYCR